MRRTGLVSWNPPAGMVEVARKRVRSHVDNIPAVGYDLLQLAINCYIQGATDALETVLNHPECVAPVPSPPELDYQI